MIEINWLSIILCGVVAMVIGMIWHNGKVFGNIYMKALGADTDISPERMKEIQKRMWQIYLTQFILVLFQAWVLWHYIVPVIGIMSPISSAIWIWTGFILPTVAAAWMWSARPRKMAWKGFLISAGYNLVTFIAFALILGAFI